MSITERNSSHDLVSSPDFSSFEGIAKHLNAWIDKQKPELTSTRYPYLFKSPQKIEALRNEKETLGNVLSIDIRPPKFPEGIKPPHITILDTPENAAVSLGRLALDPDKRIIFQLARHHTGYSAQKDMAYAMRQAMQLPEVNHLITGLEDPEGESFIIYLAREGPMINLNGGIYNELQLNVPFTTAHARHVKTDSGFGRKAEVCPINFEGLNPNEAKLLILADNTASGMQLVKVIEETLKHIDNSNGGGNNIQNIMVTSPLLTEYGAMAIAYACANKGIATNFVASEFLLNCKGKERYFSPVPNDDSYVASPSLLLLNRLMLREVNGKICSRCNWTASFSAPRAALESSNQELQQFGITNEDLIKRGSIITPELLLKMGIPPRSLIPFSTLDQARHEGNYDIIQKVLQM